MLRAGAILVLSATASCYGMPRIGGTQGTGGAGGMGGAAGTSAAGGGDAGGATGTAGTAGTTGVTGGAGASAAGGSGAGGSGTTPVFVGGPCIASPDRTVLEAFGRGSDGHIFRRAHDGANWGTWTVVAALDGAVIDARSDLDCSATLTSVHVVATGLNPVGSILHSFGFGNAYNPFVRELAPMTFDPSPSIGLVGDNDILIGGAPGGLFEFDGRSTPKEVTPITTQTDAFRSGPDIALQPAGASELRFFAAFDAAGLLAIYYQVVSSAPSYWATPIKLSAPTGSFSFSPAICTENGAFGHYSVNVAAVAGGQLWYATTSSVTASFSAWTPIAMGPAASPDCVVVGADSTVHVVTLSSTGTVIDVHGKGTSWLATDLGLPGNAATEGRGP